MTSLDITGFKAVCHLCHPTLFFCIESLSTLSPPIGIQSWIHCSGPTSRDEAQKREGTAALPTHGNEDLDAALISYSSEGILASTRLLY